jgi:aminoglycoside phosphotransferase (APT) family kinase protein
MHAIDLSLVDDPLRDKAAAALEAAFGAASVEGVRAVSGGASGALAYRVTTSSGDHLLRIEGRRLPGRNPHQYTCLELAAAAGIAPPIRYLDAEAGVVIMVFLDVRPIAEFAGGPEAAAAAAADLVGELHRLPGFPAIGDHLDDLERLIAFVSTSGHVRDDQLAPHRDAFQEIRSVYPWDPSTFVSAHNDPNEFNLLYDGRRLWLVDWETAKRNDPFIDIATLCQHLAPTPELRDLVLRRVLATEPDERARARLFLAGQLVRLFAGTMLVLITADPAAPVDLHDALTPAAFAAAIGQGDLVAGQPETTLAFATTVLRGVLDNVASDDGARAVAVLRGG